MIPPMTFIDTQAYDPIHPAETSTTDCIPESKTVNINAMTNLLDEVVSVYIPRDILHIIAEFACDSEDTPISGETQSSCDCCIIL